MASFLGHADALGVAAVLDQGEDPLPDLDAFDAGADGQHTARRLLAGAEGSVRQVLIGAFDDEDVRVVDADRGDLDQDLPGAGRRIGDVLDDEGGWRAELLDQCRAHHPIISRSLNFWILPLGVVGSSGSMTTRSGR
jgi:hypothetical protein